MANYLDQRQRRKERETERGRGDMRETTCVLVGTAKRPLRGGSREGGCRDDSSSRLPPDKGARLLLDGRNRGKSGKPSTLG